MDKKTQYNLAYAKEKLKRIPLDVQLTKYEEIAAAAAAAGESINGYIKKAIEQRMEREHSYDGPVLRLEYGVEFGKGDNSDREYWDAEISEELRYELDVCIRKADYEAHDKLCEPIVEREYPKILEKVKKDLEEAGDEWSDGYNLSIWIPFTNDYGD